MNKGAADLGLFPEFGLGIPLAAYGITADGMAAGWKETGFILTWAPLSTKRHIPLM